MTIHSALAYLSITSMLSTAAALSGDSLNPRAAETALGGKFSSIVEHISSESESAARSAHLDALFGKLRKYGKPVAEDSLVFLYYKGQGHKVSIASDLNGWNPDSSRMVQIPGSNFFYLGIPVPSSARFEYKLVVDSTWILDPGNPQQAMGGYGPNSEIWMPDYTPPSSIDYVPSIPHGRIDTLSFTSQTLHRTHPVFVYLPPGYAATRKHYPVIFVTDGGEYLALALFNTILDNLIAAGTISPVIGIFVDPRTDPRRSETSTRMNDYTMSDTFAAFLSGELHDAMLKKYRCSHQAESTAVMGASLGGLQATYTAFQHPEVFGLCAAQSPSYWWKDAAMISLVSSSDRKPLTFYIDTGTLRDASVHARRMRDALTAKGYPLHYEEHPEGHNWINWRARAESIVKYFFGK